MFEKFLTCLCHYEENGRKEALDDHGAAVRPAGDGECAGRRLRVGLTTDRVINIPFSIIYMNWLNIKSARVFSPPDFQLDQISIS